MHLKWNKEFALEQAADDAELLEELLEIFKDSLQADLLLIEQGLEEDSARQDQGCRTFHKRSSRQSGDTWYP